MKLDIYQIDAFALQAFSGNPAAVLPLTEWLPEEAMQKIAEENNLSDTAFFVPCERGFQLRWFTPLSEVKLCGHATLASAYVIKEILEDAKDEILFETLSGDLVVTCKQGVYSLDLPSCPPKACATPKIMEKALGASVVECLRDEDYIVVLETSEEVQSLAPDFELLKQLDLRGVVVTAPDQDFDFVTRFFGPKLGVNEDPVTGSAFTELIPYWAKRLGKTDFMAAQLSKRGGIIDGRLLGERVAVAGTAVEYLRGTITI